MKLVERFSMIVFSILVLVLSVLTVLVSCEIVNVDIFNDIFSKLNENVIITVCVCLLIVLWCIANIFFTGDNNSEIQNGVLLENENGSLLITKESISNLVESVLKKNPDIKDSNVKIEFDTNKDLLINIVATIKENAIIKNTSAKLQESIKLTVKRTTDLDVSNVNIKIKNIDQDKKSQVVQ